MGLWIRSQDKMKLVLIKNIVISVMSDSTWIQYEDYDGCFKLGEYKTKERALEVLNEIQDILSSKITIKSGVKDIMEQGRNIFEPTIKLYENNSIQELNSYVYEMPKE